MKRYPIVLEHRGDGTYVASAPDLFGCRSYGDTREAALDNIREAIEAWIESAHEAGDDVPDPGSCVEYVSVAS